MNKKKTDLGLLLFIKDYYQLNSFLLINIQEKNKFISG